MGRVTTTLLAILVHQASAASKCSISKNNVKESYVDANCCEHPENSVVCPYSQTFLPELNAVDAYITSVGQQLFGVNATTGAMDLTLPELVQNIRNVAAAPASPSGNEDAHEITDHPIAEPTIAHAPLTEVYIPNTEGPWPAILFIHGVGLAFTVERYRNHGKVYAQHLDAVVVHVDYADLFKQDASSNIDAHVASLQSAADWMENHLADFVRQQRGVNATVHEAFTCMGNAVGGFGCGHIHRQRPTRFPNAIFSWTWLDTSRSKTFDALDKAKNVPMPKYMETYEFLDVVFSEFPVNDPWLSRSDDDLRQNCPSAYLQLPGYDFFSAPMFEFGSRLMSLGCRVTMNFLPTRQHGWDTYGPGLGLKGVLEERNTMRAVLASWYA